MDTTIPDPYWLFVAWAVEIKTNVNHLEISINRIPPSITQLTKRHKQAPRYDLPALTITRRHKSHILKCIYIYQQAPVLHNCRNVLGWNGTWHAEMLRSGRDTKLNLRALITTTDLL